MSKSAERKDWRPTADVATLRCRSEVLQAIRDFFRAERYWEVETPLLSRETVVDANLDPIPAEYRPARGAPPQRMYLQTSPEFAMKRLLAAGADRIYQIGRAFRDGEAGPFHNPEFTMVEWYRTGDTHREQMTFTERFVRHAAAAVGEKCQVKFDREAFPVISYDEMFERAIGCRVLEKSAAELVELCDDLGVGRPARLKPDDRDGLLNLLLVERAEPLLKMLGAVFVCDYPASQSALASVRDDSPPVAERFELYLNGVELCNGYHELTDADEYVRRVGEQNRKRADDGAGRLPQDSRLFDAMQAGLPECAGVALGFDRLLMILLGKPSIQEVTAFPFDRC